MKFALLVFITVALVANLSSVFGSWTQEQKEQIIALSLLEDKENYDFAEEKNANEKNINFGCSNLSPSSSVPTDVHSLRPGDIKIIGAIGDSLTAANGAKAKTLLGLLSEDRGVSWCIGGEKDLGTGTVTLANIIRQFNPTVHGFSLGSGKFDHANARYNVADPGDTSYNMLAQAQELVKRIKAGSVGNEFNDNWKLITFFIGGNDLCNFCKDIPYYSSANFTNNIRNTLDYFQANLPRTLINMVTVINVGGILTLTGQTCRLMQTLFCDCGLQPANAGALTNLFNSYTAQTEALINSGRYDVKSDFTVVIQPFLKYAAPPTLNNGVADLSFFSPDCFHFSEKGHQRASIALWNNMLQKVGQKETTWDSTNMNALCPTAQQPYIFTNKNS